MVLPWPFLHNPIVQLVLSIPVYGLGLIYFGKSAYHSLKTGVPNMDVLIFIAASSALFYSVFGTFYYWGSHEVHEYLFFETGATIITLVLFGNLLEKRAVKKTTKSIHDLNSLQVKTAKLITEHDGQISLHDIEVNLLKRGDLIQINTGDLIPIDGFVAKGEAECDESLVSGESLPVYKNEGAAVLGGTLLLSGNLQVKVSTILKESMLSKIIEMVKKAQNSKPQIQKLGDQISAVFVPAVVLISLLTFLVSYFFLDLGSAKSMLRAVAVLVISCPCAMGLATPTAIMVGIGKAAKRGILIKGGSVLENFAKSKQIVFDKTGTLSTGKFVFTDFDFKGNENELKQLIYSLESHSSHPIAKALVEQYPSWNQYPISFKEINERKGKGMEATDSNGDILRLGSAKWLGILDNDKDLFLVQNEKLMAAWNIADEIKEDAHELIAYLNSQGIETILLSGDKQKKVDQLAKELGMETALGEKLPEEKLAYISKQVESNPELVMVGDGVNDAPALSKVAVGVSFVKGSDMAIEAANVVLMHNGLKSLQEAHIISKLTYKTIKQNLFWAFLYNILCIPLAAAGFMHPMLGALSMAFSDVIVIGNSLLLGLKKIKADK